MDTVRIQTDGTHLFARVQTTPSPVVLASPSPTQKMKISLPVNAAVTFSPTSLAQRAATTPIHLSAEDVNAGVVIATRQDVHTNTPIHLISDREIATNVVIATRQGSISTTPVQQMSEKGSASLVSVATRRDFDANDYHPEESRLNMSRYSSVLNSLSDQDQASMDLEVQAVMFPESRGLLPTVKRICPSRSSSSSKASSKSSYSPMRQSTTFTNTKRGNIQTTTPTFSLGEQSIHQLAAQGEQSLIAEKLEAGVDVDEADSQGHTPLTWACQHHQTDMVRFLLERNADPRKTSMEGETALAFACSIGNPDMVEMLLKRNAPVNVYDYNGGTPLIYAVYHNHPPIVQMLLDYGADMTIEMESGHTPLSLAMALGHKQVQRVIEQYMLSLFRIS